MSKFIGKIINSSRVLPNINNAGGIWNTIEQLQAQKTNTWPITEFKNIALPEITGTAIIGYTSLGCTTGTWSIDRNVIYAYQWKRNNVAIPGATANVYTLVPADGENILTCSVTITYTLTNESRTATSLPTSAIFIPIQDQVEYTTPGTYTWVCPENVYNVSVVCIGGGGGGAYFWDSNPAAGVNGHINLHSGGGGGLGWKNNITVVPGQSYTVQVGAAGTASTFLASASTSFTQFPYTAGDSYFINNTTVCGKAGASGYATVALGYTGTWPMVGVPGGGFTGDGGGSGGFGGEGTILGSTSTSPPSGFGGRSGGGGTGGYSGNGGTGGAGMPNSSTNNITPGSEGNGYDAYVNSGGGGGGQGDGSHLGSYSNGTTFVNNQRHNSGRGTGIYGKGTTGIGGLASSYNSLGDVISFGTGPSQGSGGNYGYGGRCYYDPGTVNNQSSADYNGGSGAVRIIWPGNLRQYPTTRTTNETDVLVAGVLLPIVTINQGTATSFKPVASVRGKEPYTYIISPSLPAGLSLNANTGVISGTTTVYQLNSIYTITITDTVGQSSSKSFTLNCDYALDGTYSPIVTTVAVPAFSANQADEVSFTPVTATGGLTPYTFTTDRLLPADLVMDSATGTISGNTDYIYNQVLYKVIVRDSSNRTNSAYFTLSILPILSIVSIVLVPSTTTTIGVPVDIVPIEVFDGLAPYTYIIEPSLPAGLTLDSATGNIKGVPTTTTPVTTYTMTVVDSVQGSTSQTFTISSVLTPVTIARTMPGNGVIIERLNTYLSYEPVVASGGAQPYVYSISPTLPNGLSLNSSTGIISGTPTTLQALTTYTITVTDAYNQTASTTITITITIPALTTTILVPSITAARGVFFQSTPVGVTSGVSPYSYSISPALPSGIALNTSTGVISGTPAAGLTITSYTITVTDFYSQTSSKQISLYVNAEGVTGQSEFTTPGTYSLVVPAGVYSVSYVAVGAGARGVLATSTSSAASGGAGGCLAYRNTVAVTPGDTISIVVGATGAKPSSYAANKGGDSTVTINSVFTTAGGGGNASTGHNELGAVSGTYTAGFTGGYGGAANGNYASGGGGAAGYSGVGGYGAWQARLTPTAGAGGGGGGGGLYTGSTGSGNGGGGVGIYGQGSNGTAGGGGGGGGSGGTTGQGASGYCKGGLYGGGGGGYRIAVLTAANTAGADAGAGGDGAVRIIWPGSTRVFPSTNTMDM